MSKVLIFILIFILFGCYEVKTQKSFGPNKKYEVTVSNIIGHGTSYCNYYKKDGNTYQLFDKDSLLLEEIMITEGWRIEIRNLQNE
jgi:uncharacterized protein YodC (DUF2158 family)